jgi:IS30 family transposase
MTTQTTKPPTKHHKACHRITPEKSKAILAMKTAGMSNPKIAKETNLTPSGVWRHLKRITPEHHEFQTLKSNLPDQFIKLALDNANLSARLTNILMSKTDEELNSISPVNIAAVKRTADVGLGIMHDHYRLEAGLSTSNLASITADIAELQRMDRSGKSVHSPVDK